MPTAGSTGFTTYDLTVGVKLDVEDAIYLLSPFDTPLQTAVDGSGRSALSTGPVSQKKYEWHDETLLTQRTTLAANMTNSQTTATVATGDGLKFAAGDVILLDSELVRVTSVSTDTLTITRSYASSVAATHATSVAAVGVGQALPEGSDPSAARANDRVNRYNYTQIFGPWKVHVTGTENVIDKYGLSGNEFDHQTANRFKEMAVTMEQALLYGERLEDTSNKWRTFGGLRYWITSNVDSSTTTLTEALFLDRVQAAYDAGGNPDRIVVGSKQKRVISAWNATLIRYNQNEDSRGQVVENYDSDFGRQSIILDRWVRTSDLFGFNRDQAEILTLRPWQFEMLAKTGDAISGMIVGEKGFKLRRESHAFRFSALT